LIPYDCRYIITAQQQLQAAIALRSEIYSHFALSR